MTLLSWSFGNAKVSKLRGVSFGIPAYKGAEGFKTCPKAGACAAVCYARQGRYIMPSVREARERNLAAIRNLGYRTFARAAIADLAGIKETLVRIHDSGDFFAQGYLEAWADVARMFPEKTFYAYTKSLHLDFSKLPENFRMIQSEGGTMDPALDRRRPHSRIFATHADRRRAGYGDGSRTDTLAIRGEVKIGLVYHGSRNMTEAQRNHFS